MPQRGPPKGNNSNESTPKPVPKPNQKRGDNKGNTPKKPEPMDTGSKSDAFNLGKPLEIERPQNEEEEAGGGQSRLFVGGLPQGVSTEQVRGLFKQYGDVKDVYIPAVE